MEVLLSAPGRIWLLAVIHDKLASKMAHRLCENLNSDLNFANQRTISQGDDKGIIS
jgi:hypothetical protein